MEYVLSEQIDGVKGDGYGTPVSFLVANNRSVSVWAKSDAYGVYLYFEAYSDTAINTSAIWWENHNFEYYLNGGEQSYVNTKGESARASHAVYNHVLLSEGDHSGKYFHSAEVYVNRNWIPNFNAESVTLNYAFKAPGELARYEYMINNQYRWCPDENTYTLTDWWRTSHSAPLAEHSGIGTVAVPRCIHITAAGLVHDCERASIDGDLSEYEGKNAFIGMGNDNAKFDFVGYVAEDGVYLGITIHHNGISNTNDTYWHVNDNIQIKLLGDRAGFSIIEGFVTGCGPVSDYAIVRTEGENGYTYKTVVELFYEHDFSTAKQATFQVGVNGDGFGGWQALMWDGNVPYITENGIEWITTGKDWYNAQLDVADKFAAGEGLTIDGVADEALYADLTSVTYDNVNGAKMVITGRKLSTGIIFYSTITHTRPITDVIQGDGGLWWNHIGLEFRIGGNYTTQMAVSTINNGDWDQYCAGKNVTVQNEDGTYTTSFEVFIPFTTEEGGMNYNGDVQVCVGGPIETGFTWVTGVETSPLYANENGFILK